MPIGRCMPRMDSQGIRHARSKRAVELLHREVEVAVVEPHEPHELLVDAKDRELLDLRRLEMDGFELEGIHVNVVCRESAQRAATENEQNDQ